MTPELSSLKFNFESVFDSATKPEVTTLAGEMSTRKYYRIFVSPKKSSSFEQKLSSYVLQASDMFHDPKTHPFLLAQKIFDGIGIRVPKIIGTAGHEGWILVEDCGDFFLQYRQEIDLYRQTVDMLLALQKKAKPEFFANDPLLQNALHWNWSFDFKKLNDEMLHCEKFFVNGLLGDGFSFAKAIAPNSQWLADRPRILCHRDFHSRNLMIKEELVYAIDFQDARMGPVSYDLVSLLWDPYANLLESFRQKLLLEWKNQTEDRFHKGLDEEIERMKIQRLMKAIGSYSSFFLDRKNPACLVFIEGALGDVVLSFETLAAKSLLKKEEQPLLKFLKKIQREIVSSC